MHEFLSMWWGYKTQAIFDVWSLEHFLTGVSVGTAVMLNNHKSLGDLFSLAKEKMIHTHKHINWLKYKYDLVFLLLIAYIWETLEHYLESGIAGERVAYWFQGVEFWPNRLLADPIMIVLGYLFAKKFPITVWPARFLSLLWLILHIFVFPHSMYLQILLHF